MLAFSSVLLLLIIKFYRDRRKTDAAVEVSTLARVPKGMTWRQRWIWVPRALIAAGMMAVVLSVANPRESGLLQKMVVPVTKVLSLLDISGSMASAMDGSTMSKIDAAIAGERAFIQDQRKGATNQVGVAMWDTKVVVISPLTTDLDLAETTLEQIKAGGGTDADLAIRTGINVFLKRNIVEIDEALHPEATELKRAMRAKGLGAALQIFFKEPQGSALWNLVVRPDQAKVIRLSTDGDSSGDPIKAAQMAKYYGIKIHTIGIPASDLKEDVLAEIAHITGGRYARADDAKSLADIHLAISEEIKTPVAVTIPSEKSYEHELSVLAFVSVGLGLLLANLKLRLLSLAA